MAPYLAVADNLGNIRENPDLLMLINRCGQWTLPAAEDLIPLPPESDLFLLPGRNAVGFDPVTGKVVATRDLAVAAFAAPGYTLSAHPAYMQAANAPILPLFAYGAVGYGKGRFWLAASQVDDEPRQQFAGIKRARMEREAASLLKKWPRNRLIRHIVQNCVRRYSCPAARNFALGRYEAPLPSSTACNARCVGCISHQESDSPILTTPQCRLAFIPTADEIAEVMSIHEQRETMRPIYSFGQGCEGDPLCNAPLLCESMLRFRNKRKGGHGTINCNCNGSRTEVIADLARAGLTSMRVSLHSSQPALYAYYHRPQGYSFADVCASMKIAREHGIYLSLNLLYFPGITDTWSELATLAELCRDCGVSMIQWRNLNIDPLWYSVQLERAKKEQCFEPALGLAKFMAELKKRCPWLRYGYFNPYLGDKAEISAPMPR